jgi:DNA-binding Xre family transcriptional regulator
MMISYDPLHKTLEERGLTMNEMRKNKLLNSRTIARINKGQSVNLSTIEKICVFLDVPIEKVVRITK